MMYTVVGEGADWIHNTYVAVLHDGGALGFVFFVLGWISLLFSGWRAIGAANQPIRSRLFGLWLAAWALLLTGNSNNLSWMALYWIYYGLLAAGVQVHAGESTRLAKVENTSQI